MYVSICRYINIYHSRVANGDVKGWPHSYGLVKKICFI